MGVKKQNLKNYKNKQNFFAKCFGLLQIRNRNFVKNVIKTLEYMLTMKQFKKIQKNKIQEISSLLVNQF